MSTFIPEGSYKKAKFTLGFTFVNMETREKYKGFYIEDALGKYYSGKEVSKNSIRLEKVELKVPSGLKAGLKAAAIAMATGLAKKVVSKIERQNGKTKRYFVQDKSTNKISETDKDTFNQAKLDLPNQNFAEVDWILQGPAEDMMFGEYKFEGAASKNQKAIQAIESQITGISKFITDYAYLVEEPVEAQKLILTTQTFVQKDPDTELDGSRKARFDKRTDIRFPSASSWIEKIEEVAPVPRNYLGAPLLNTKPITSIVVNKAASGGDILNTGGYAIISKGICWNTGSNPTTALTTKTSVGAGPVLNIPTSFSSNITGLSSGTTYYVRAYAVNQIGTSYGNEVEFTTVVGNVLRYAYSLRKVVDDYEGYAIQLLKGIKDQSIYTAKDFSFDRDTGELNQEEILNWLAAYPAAYLGRAYVRRWYDQSGNGNTLGLTNPVNERQPQLVNGNTFYTKDGRLAMQFGLGDYSYLRSVETLSIPLNKLSMFIVCSNNGTGIASPIDLETTEFPKPNVGGNDYFYYAGANRINLGITNTDNKVYSSFSTPTAISAWKNNISLGSPVSVSSTVTSTTINVGSNFPEKFNGTIQEMLFYDEDVVDRTARTAEIIDYYGISAIQIPGFITRAAFNIKALSADSGGDIPSYSETPYERGLLWGTSADLSVATEDKIVDSSGGFGSYTANIPSVLTPSTKFYLRAYVKIPSGLVYAPIISFTTPSGIPLLTTTLPDPLPNKATSGGSITSDGGYAITSKGVCWSTSAAPTISLPTKTSDGAGSDSFTSHITGLNTETLYYVRAYAINEIGKVGYGDEVTFTTLAGDVLKHAYSLRRVVPEYTGPAVTLSKYKYGSTVLTKTFYFDAVTGELDQTAIRAFLETNTQYSKNVSIWYDQTGNGKHLQNATSGRQPLIAEANGSLITKNGKLALRFFNGYCFLSTLPAVISVPLNKTSVFVVCSNSGSGTAAPVELYNSTAYANYKFPKPNVGGNDYFYYAGANRINLGPTNLDNKVYTNLSNTTSISAWKNNVSIGSPVSVANTVTATTLNVGSLWVSLAIGNTVFTGTIQEILIYDGTANSRADTTDEIMQYYKIPPYDV